MKPEGVQVRGAATPEEVAAVLAALQARTRAAESKSTLQRWRCQRQHVLRDNR
jgi:hypothetical protein